MILVATAQMFVPSATPGRCCLVSDAISGTCLPPSPGAFVSGTAAYYDVTQWDGSSRPPTRKSRHRQWRKRGVRAGGRGAGRGERRLRPLGPGEGLLGVSVPSPEAR